ncbi:efflux RND transporter periplasmic adaptor subunit [Gelria sp. Kuro-4]|uniref:efflux RND transporter periplasmic adaptor subunit n=1 Tax=Gelria sp. Kuro-4 TaxID=2796927 RepID=UPI001C7F4020|nr:HlyD family efflux transporter periplasmic adaptor subunit [Gelria sp. Kuro-4]
MQVKSRTFVFIGTGLVLALLAGYAGLHLLGRPKASAQQAAKTVQVSRGAIEVAVSGSGNVAFAEDVQLKAQASGKVVQVLVKDGEQVKAGQTLFVLENSSLELQREQAQSTVDNLSTELEQLQKDMAALRVTAPQAGRITAIAVGEGDKVTEGASLVTLVDDATFSVTVPFLKPQRDQITAGQAAEVFLPDFLSSLHGKVVRVSGSGQPGTGGTVVYPVTVEFANPGALTEGVKATVTVQTKQGPVEALEMGTAAPKKVAEVRSAVAGEVKAVGVEVGDKVQPGQLLVKLANDDLPNQLAQKQDSLSQAKLNLATQNDQLARLTVTAPISGVFREVQETQSSDGTVLGPVQVGDELKPNDLLGRIVNNSSYEVVVKIDELDISQVQLGQKAEITVDALPGQTLQGTVTQIAEEGTVQNGAAVYPVTLTLPPTPGLKAGMTANARILVAAKDNALLLPVEAVQDRNGRFFVALPAATESTQGKQGRRQEIKVGLHNEAFVEVLEGLQEGDTVLLAQTSTTPAKQENSARPPMPGMMPGGFGGSRPRA